MNKNAHIVAVIIVAALLGGCKSSTIYYEYREIENLELISAIGIDDDENGVTVTVCSDSNSENSRITRKSAGSVAMALAAMQNNSSGKQPFYAHTDHIVIGENAAKNGISGYLDYIERATEIRSAVNVFIVKNGTAEELIEKPSSQGASASEMLLSIERNIEKSNSGYVSSVREICADLTSRGDSLCLAVELSEDEKQIIPAGFAVIKNGRLTGYVPPELAHSVCTVMNRPSFGEIIVDDGAGGKAVLSYKELSSDIVPDFQNNTIYINVDCGLNVEEMQNAIDLNDRDARNAIAVIAAQKEADDIMSAVKLAQTMETDFMNIGGAINMKHHREYRKLADEWSGAFAEMEFAVTAKATLVRTYDITIPMGVAGETESESE